MIGKNFQTYGIQITGKCICELKKIKVDIFTQAPLEKSPSGSSHQPTGREKLLIPPGNIFLKTYSPSRKGRGIKLRPRCSYAL